jgi:1,5-anhydro-D-fructose reductase (1,5-anhydro-D-mannitol-forming)
MSIGWGIVGTGSVAGRSIAPAIDKLPGAHLVGSVGSTPEKAERFAAEHGGRAFGNLDDLLGDDEVELVYIGTPNALHADQAVAAAAAGKHVFCDKPLATSPADARRVVDACESAGVKLGVNFQTRHHEGMRAIKDAIADGEIGDPVIVQCEIGSGRNPPRGWRTDRALAGLGSTNNLGVHAYDAVRYLLGSEVEEVTALTDSGRGDELETAVLALLRFANGTLASVNANQAVSHPQPDLVVYGTTGRIAGRRVTRPNNEDASFTILSDAGDRTIPAPTGEAFDRSVAAFQHAVSNNEEPNASGLDGLRSAELTDAIARSAREGRTVAVEKG